MHFDEGDVVLFTGAFSIDWELCIPNDTPTIVIERFNLSTETWDIPVNGSSVTVRASGVCYYSYTSSSGDYLYEARMVTTDNRVDAQTVLLETHMSGSWAAGLSNFSLLLKLLRNPWRRVAPNYIELYDIGVDVLNITTEEPIEKWALYDANENATLTDVYFFNRVDLS